MKTVGHEQDVGANQVPGTRVCNLPAWKSIWKGRSERRLPSRSLGKVRMVAGGGGTATPCARALGNLAPSQLFYSKSCSEPSLSQRFLCCQRRELAKCRLVLPTVGCVSTMGLKLRGAVAQWQFRCCDPLPRLCARQAAGGTGRRRQPSPCWPGAPRTRPCTEAGFARQAWEQNCIVASQPHRGDVGWALPAAF